MTAPFAPVPLPAALEHEYYPQAERIAAEVVSLVSAGGVR